MKIGIFCAFSAAGINGCKNITVFLFLTSAHIIIMIYEEIILIL